MPAVKPSRSAVAARYFFPPALKRVYSKSGCSATALFPGSVHGVVVQIATEASFSSLSLPVLPLTAKLT